MLLKCWHFQFKCAKTKKYSKHKTWVTHVFCIVIYATVLYKALLIEQHQAKQWRRSLLQTVVILLPTSLVDSVHVSGEKINSKQIYTSAYSSSISSSSSLRQLVYAAIGVPTKLILALSAVVVQRRRRRSRSRLGQAACKSS